MPVKMRKVGSGKVRVSTPSGTKAKATTPAKAAKQRRLLEGIDRGWKPTKKKRLLSAVEHSNWRPTGKKARR